MSYGSLPQGQKGLTLSPWRLGTAGMTLSEQTNNTTLNILHGVRRSDLPLLPPLPTSSVRLPLSLVLSSFGRDIIFCSYWLRWCGALLLMWGSISRGLSYLHVCFSGAALTWIMLSLPSFVLSLTFRSLSGKAGLAVSVWCFCLRVCWCFSVCVVLLSVGGWAPVCLVGSPLCRMLLLFPPAVGPFVRWSLPLGIWLHL